MPYDPQELADGLTAMCTAAQAGWQERSTYDPDTERGTRLDSTIADRVGKAVFTLEAPGSVDQQVLFVRPMRPLGEMNLRDDYMVGDRVCDFWWQATSDSIDSRAAMTAVDHEGFTLTLQADSAGTFEVCWCVGQMTARMSEGG